MKSPAMSMEIAPEVSESGHSPSQSFTDIPEEEGTFARHNDIDVQCAGCPGRQANESLFSKNTRA